MLGSLDDPSQKTQSLKCFSYPRHPKSSKYLVRRCGRNPSKPNLRKCLGVQTPTHQIFGCLGIDTIPLSQYLNHLKGKSPFYPRLTSFTRFSSISRVLRRYFMVEGQYEDPLNLCKICCLSEKFGNMLLIQGVQMIPRLEVIYSSKGHFTIPKESQRIARILKLSVDGKETTPFSK